MRCQLQALVRLALIDTHRQWAFIVHALARAVLGNLGAAEANALPRMRPRLRPEGSSSPPSVLSCLEPTPSAPPQKLPYLVHSLTDRASAAAPNVNVHKHTFPSKTGRRQLQALVRQAPVVTQAQRTRHQHGPSRPGRAADCPHREASRPGEPAMRTELENAHTRVVVFGALCLT